MMQNPQQLEHYYIKEPKSKLHRYKLKAAIHKKEIEFYTASGLFSPKHIDKGTELLINKAIVKLNWHILDLACGYGIVGLAILISCPGIKVTFSDVNKRAVQITNLNLKLHKLKAEVIQSNLFENIHEKYDTILLNPPQTAGKKICFDLIEQSKSHLKKGGLLQIVARHNKGGRELSKKMYEIFGNIKATAKRTGYRIYISENS